MPLQVVPRGQAVQADADLVRAELARLPAAVADALARRGVAVVACRLAVTDFAPELAHEQPEGWPAGTNWTVVPGAYLPARKAVAIATRGPDAGGARRVPRYGEGHGARSLAVHETVHGYDYSSGDLQSQNRAFRDAWQADKPLLGDPYFTGAQWGPRESYAESAAREFGTDQSQAGAWPHLAAFWRGFAGFSPSRWMRATAPIRRLFALRPEPLGRAILEPGGDVHLDLVAESPSGAVGHGRLTYRPGDPGYDAVMAHVAPGRRVREGGARTAETVLVQPFR